MKTNPILSQYLELYERIEKLPDDSSKIQIESLYNELFAFTEKYHEILTPIIRSEIFYSSTILNDKYGDLYRATRNIQSAIELNPENKEFKIYYKDLQLRLYGQLVLFTKVSRFNMTRYQELFLKYLKFPICLQRHQILVLLKLIENKMSFSDFEKFFFKVTDLCPELMIRLIEVKKLDLSNTKAQV